ncbi:MAG: type IX secretion system membrane protein PorP/SprF [Bacteroidota bacterium]
MVTLLSLLSMNCFAQQQVMFTQYMFNNLAINPGYAGTTDALSVTALARRQWVGVDGAPNTQTLATHAAIPNTRVGVGLLFVRDAIGISEENTLIASSAYKLQIAEGKTLSMGLQAGFSSYTHDYTDLGIIDDDKFLLSSSLLVPNIGFGLFYHSERLYAGFSAPYLLNRKLRNASVDLSTEQIRHFYAQGGYVFDINPSLKLRPHLLLKMVPGAPVETDISANFIYKDLLWMGAAYRSLDAVNFLFQVQASDQFRVGYAYDYTLSELNQVTSGSHEIMVQYVFSFSKHSMVTPRYF